VKITITTERERILGEAVHAFRRQSTGSETTAVGPSWAAAPRALKGKARTGRSPQLGRTQKWLFAGAGHAGLGFQLGFSPLPNRN
jgi:hypothetical protein